MAKILFDKGDAFIYQGGAGVVIGEDLAVLILGPGGRTGFEVMKGIIPSKAIPVEIENLDFQVQMAIRGAIAAVS